MAKPTVEDKVFDCIQRLGKDDVWDKSCQESLVDELAPTGQARSWYDDHEIQAYWVGYFDAMVFWMTRLDPRFDAWRLDCPQ